MEKNEAIGMVLDGLQHLIRMGARASVRFEYCPTHDVDSDEDAIRDGKVTVAELRSLRQRFEDLMLSGQIDEYESSKLQKWFDTPQEVLDNHTPRQMGLRAP